MYFQGNDKKNIKKRKKVDKRINNKYKHCKLKFLYTERLQILSSFSNLKITKRNNKHKNKPYNNETNSISVVLLTC